MSLNEVVRDADTMLRRLIGEDIEVVTAYGSGPGTCSPTRASSTR